MTKQRRNYAWYSAWLRLLLCQGVDPTLLQACSSGRAESGSQLVACSLWIEIKWLSTGQSQPGELLHWRNGRLLSQRVHAYPTHLHMQSQNFVSFSFVVMIWPQKKKKIHSVHRKCKISHRALGVAERELAVDASSYGSAVNSNSLALLLQGSGHFELQSLCTVCVRLC